MNNLEIYGLKKQAWELFSMLTNEEIDQETYDLQLSFYKEELAEKAGTLVEVFKHFETNINGVDEKIKQLKAYKDFLKAKDEKFKTKIKDLLLMHGVESGKSKGLMTPNGILYLHKSQKTILPNLDEVLDDYKIFRAKNFDLTAEEIGQLPENLKEKFQNAVQEIKLNKDLYEEKQTKLKKEANYTLKVF